MQSVELERSGDGYHKANSVPASSRFERVLKSYRSYS